MTRVESYLSQAISLIKAYDGKVPFSIYIKKFFSNHKKFGSRDRRSITALCYSYFRLGQTVKDIPINERILFAVFLCNPLEETGMSLLPDSLSEFAPLQLQEKIKILQQLQPEFDFAGIFPFEGISKEVEVNEFKISHLIQPNLFIRIRPNKSESVIIKLHSAAIPFHLMEENCLALPNGVKLEKILKINREVIIQDYSSQAIKKFLELIPKTHPLKIWDCCAGSGGKSILAMDFLPVSELYVSDIRKSILYNLKTRFLEAGLKQPNIFEVDLTESALQLNSKFDLIICDVPCTGSGTWGRTPEQLLFFKEVETLRYNHLQKAIVSNALKSVKNNGWFLYITCSVFEKENEEMVAFLEKNTSLTLIKSSVLKGYNQNADTLFAALFQLSA